MKQKKIVNFIIVFLFFVASRTAQAAIFWDFEITNNNTVIAPTDNFVLQARITNLASSDMDFDLQNANLESHVVFYPGLIDSTLAVYSLGIPSSEVDTNTIFQRDQTLFRQIFNGITLAPGESFDFEYGTWALVGDEAPVRTSFGEGHEIGVTYRNGSPETIYNWINWDVAHQQNPNSASPSAVPEPATMALVGLGLVGAAVRKRFKK